MRSLIKLAISHKSDRCTLEASRTSVAVVTSPSSLTASDTNSVSKTQQRICSRRVTAMFTAFVVAIRSVETKRTNCERTTHTKLTHSATFLPDVSVNPTMSY